MRIGKRISVGLLSLAFGMMWAGTADAAPSVTTATIASPDSGTKVGIDGTVTVTVDVFQASADKDLQVLSWLVSGGDNATALDVLFDGTQFNSPDNRILEALQDVSAIGDGSAADQLTAFQGGGVSAGAGGYVTVSAASKTPLKDVEGVADAGSFIAARQMKNSAEGAAAVGLPLDGVFGDANTAAAATKVVDGTGDSYTYTIALKVPPSAGETSSVRVASVVYDPNALLQADKFSTITISNPVTVDIDGDRPSHAGISIDPTDGTGSTGDVYIQFADGTSNRNVAAGTSAPVIGFTVGAATRDVAKTGDQLRVNVDLDEDDVAGPGPNENAIKKPNSTLSLIVDLFGTEFTVDKSQSGSVLSHATTIAAGDFGNLAAAPATAVTTIRLFVEDAAGNRSSFNTSGENGNSLTGDDATATGVTNEVDFLADSTNPSVSGAVDDADATKGNRAEPAGGETISDGTINDADDADTHNVDSDGSAIDTAKDAPLLSYHPDEDLSSMKIDIAGSGAVITVLDASPQFLHDALASDARTYVDISGLSADNGPAITNEATAPATFRNRAKTLLAETNSYTSVGTAMTDGTYDITFTPTDLAGNVGAAVTASDVVIDMTNMTFKRRFPTKASFGPIVGVGSDRRDTVNATTANVTFALSEAADSVKIIFDDLTASNDTCFVLSTAQLADVNEQTIIIGPSLTDDTNYSILVVGRDTAGNYTLAGPDTLHFNVEYVAPAIAQFLVEVVDATDPPVVQAIGTANPFTAGASLLLRIKAADASTTPATAVTFAEDAILTVTAGSPSAGTTITGDGVVSTSDTTWSLAKGEFVVGQQTVTLKNTAAPEDLIVSVIDADTMWSGTASDSISFEPDVYSAILVDAPDSVDQGETFRVDVTLADQFGNTRTGDNRFVEVTSNVAGAGLPAGALAIKKGVGWFDAVFASGSTHTHTITVRDIVNTPDVTTPSTDTGDDFLSGSDAIYVNSGPTAINLDGPDSTVAEDFMGASGNGDQGGFVLLSFDASTDHGSLDEYLIEREITVTYGIGATSGKLEALAEATKAWVAWGSAAPTPGANVMYVVVATLDGDSSRFAVSAVRGGVTAKKAFDVSDNVSSPYELMAQTMMKSKELAQVSADAPVFATLTPEALAFSESGVVPRLKTGGSAARSLRAVSNLVRSLDNIAPAPVPYLKALDTPSDAGGSITLRWSKSPDDQMLTQTVPQAIGGANVYTTPGVRGYNIYRKAGNGAFTLIDEAGPGETSFADETVFNGMQYAYQVKPRDADNIASSELQSSALAVRNNVRDQDGKLVYGLFGVDNRVDFDDFFILADRFGQDATAKTFDPAFDLNPNNKIDLDDFFIFVDNFGRSITASGKVVPMLAGLNSDARFYIDAGTELPRIGEEMTLAVSLEEFVELQGYGLTVNYDEALLEFVGAQVEDNILGEDLLARPQVIPQADGQVSIGAFGDAVSEGDLGLSLIFRSKAEIEDSYIEITDAALRDGGYGVNAVPTPVSVRIQTRPEVYALANNYPNPFNPETTLKYQLPDAADVTLEIYNMLGQVVRTLVNEHQNAGRYALQWDATNDNGHALSSGIYFYRIQAGSEFRSVKKMLLVK